MSLIRDLSESKYKSVALYAIIAAGTLLPGVLILDVYNKELLLTASFGLTVLYALAITLPIFIINFIVLALTNSSELAFATEEELKEDVFEEFISTNLLASGLVCFLGNHFFIIFSIEAVRRFGHPPTNEQVIKIVFIVELVFIVYRLICFVRNALSVNRVNNSRKRM